MHRLNVYQTRPGHADELRGSLPVPESFRPPMSDAEMEAIPGNLIARSRSWLLEIRPRDLRLAMRGEGKAAEMVIIAAPGLCPGDFGCLVGFEPATDDSPYRADEEMLDLADRIAADFLRERANG